LYEILSEQPSLYDDVDLALARLRKAFAVLPSGMLAQISAFGRHAHSPGALYLRNLPTDPQIPPTPTDGEPSPKKRTFISESVLLGLTDMIGAPTAYETEKRGHLVHDVVPVASGATSQTNQGSKVFLTFHNDLVFDESGQYDVANPDFIILVCVRQDPSKSATTFYADARSLLETLSREAAATLRQPLFRLNAPGGYVEKFADGKETLSPPISVMSGPLDAPDIRLSANGVRGLTPAAVDALEELTEACQRVSVAVKLVPGDALMINNRKGVHARSSFPARHDGTDRWLQRTYVRRETWTIRHRVSGDEGWIH